MKQRNERGETVIEMILWIPVIVGMMLLAIYGARLTGADGEVQDAAQSGARAASLARNPADAAAQGSAAANASLPARSPRCVSTAVSVDVSRWGTGLVAVTVSCTTSGDELGLIGVGAKTITKTWTEPVDPARTTERN